MYWWLIGIGAVAVGIIKVRVYVKMLDTRHGKRKANPE